MQNTVKHDKKTPSESKGLIKTPRQLIITVILAFLIPIIVIIMLVKLVAITSPMGAGSKAQTEEAIAQRLQPVAGFKLVDTAAQEAAPVDQAAQTDDTAEKPAAEPEQTAAATSEVEQKQAAAGEIELDPAGEKLYKSICFTCHTTGIANAPKLGDKASWAPYIATGFDTMLEKSIQGVGAMPPRGGSQASDDEMKAALEYMLSKVEWVDAAAQEAAPADQAAQTDDTAEKPAAEPEQTAAAAPESEQKQAAVSEAELDPAGEKLYKSICFTCHTTGIANAPKLGDKAGWAPYIATGFDTMLEKSIQGVGAMPPRGGSQASDEEMKAVLEYMLSKVQ